MKKEFIVTSKHMVFIAGKWETIFDPIRHYKTLKDAKAGIKKFCESQSQKNERVISWSLRMREVSPWYDVESYKEV